LISTGLADLGYRYMNLDDCWQANGRDANGKVQPETSRFPSGLSALGEYIHTKNLKFGIYSSAGFKTCQGYPASLGLEDIDAQSYVEWGVDYLKYDNCYTDHGLPQIRYKEMADALQRTGREFFYSLCEWGRENPAVWASGIGAQSWRISGDISDDWRSVISRAKIGASLWRFSGPGKGWNDPDMLEVGNGGCSDDEYRSHFSLWAMLKAPLIIGNDIRTMSTDSAAYAILSNKEVIAVNQDALGLQGRIVWSDTTEKLAGAYQYGEKLIATKCATGAPGAYEDQPEDQQWQYHADDHTIRSVSTGRCLRESDAKANFAEFVEATSHFDLAPGLRTVTAVDCASADVTKWDLNRGDGAAIVSRSSGLCLEVAKESEVPEVQGKRIQTAPCHTFDKQDHTYFDISEHQSWSMPQGKLLNLYQRQCLTVDRDAYPGASAEVWAAPLEGDRWAVMVLNKGKTPNKIQLTLDMLQLPASKKPQRFGMRDLWKHEDLTLPLTASQGHEFVLKGHESAMLVLTPLA
jgi:hypothetical protein